MTRGLPQLYREIVEAAGIDAARALAEAKAGQRIYIPKNLSRAGWLIAIVGEKPARKIIDAFGGVEIILPTNPFGERGQWGRVRRIHRMLDEGMSANQIVASEGCGFSTVRYHRSKRRERDDQPDLFSKS